MRRIALACGLGVSLAASGCLGGGGGGGGGSTPNGNGSGGNNRAPLIGGRPRPEVIPHEFYEFRPSASDPEGNLLVFSISNKPAWTTFDQETGRLTGTPREADVGIYTGITIVVSDGYTSTALPSFEIEVVQHASGLVTLSWTPPTENEDGSTLEDLAGYRIYMGRNPNSLSRVIVLNNPGLTRYVIENLSPATWHFAMTSVNGEGRESHKSAVVKKDVG